jgi:hypothetical protein
LSNHDAQCDCGTLRWHRSCKVSAAIEKDRATLLLSGAGSIRDAKIRRTVTHNNGQASWIALTLKASTSSSAT